MRGFSFFELMISLSIGFFVLSVILSGISSTVKSSKKINNDNRDIEAIFHTVDIIKSDLDKCGMRLIEYSNFFDINIIQHNDTWIKLEYGISDENLLKDAKRGELEIIVNKNEFFKKNKYILIYDLDYSSYQVCRIKDIVDNRIVLYSELLNDFKKGSEVIVLKSVEYKYYEKDQILKRKVDNGYFQPLIENVSDFYVTYFNDSNAILYKLEVNKKQQVRGFVFLNNMVMK